MDDSAGVIVFLDLDGVMVDFTRAAFKVLGCEEKLDNWPPGSYEIEDVAGVSMDAFWDTLDAQGPEFWATLPKLPWADELLKMVGDWVNDPWNQLFIATSPSRAPASAMGKVHWMRDYFGLKFRRYMLGSHKYLLAGPGRVLIDDSDAKVKKFVQFGGTGILFPQPWNSNHDLLGDQRRLTYVAHQLAIIKHGTHDRQAIVEKIKRVGVK
jgi:5'(3')-deoxyribonucleotidase